MKNTIFVTNTYSILMPQTHIAADWEKFFIRLMATDFSAPLFSAIHYLAVMYGLDTSDYPSVYSSLYRDIGIEMASEGCFPAKGAALNTDFLPTGITMLISIFNEESTSHETAAVIQKLLSDTPLVLRLSNDTIHKAKSIIQRFSHIHKAG